MSVISSWFQRNHCKRHKEPEKAIANLTPAQCRLVQQKDKIYKGQCKWFNKGYGYVCKAGDEKETGAGNEFFVHSSEIKGENGHKRLVPGQEIEFKLAIGEDNKLIVVNVTGVNGVPVPRQLNTVEVKPKNVVEPGMFNKLHRGSVLWFDFNKRYGFITRGTGEENFFVHASEIYTRNYRNLAGQNCEFRITRLRGGRLVAVRVTGSNGVILRLRRTKKEIKQDPEETKAKEEADAVKEKEVAMMKPTSPVTPMSIRHASMLKKNKPSVPGCEKCKKTFNTEFDQKMHYASNKHLGIKKTKAKKWGNRHKIKRDGTIGPKKPGENVLKLRCELCNVEFTGETQEKMHLEGKKHTQKLRQKENPRPKGYGFWRGKRRMATSDVAATKRRAAAQTAQTQAYQQAAATAAASKVAYDPYGMAARSQSQQYSNPTPPAPTPYKQPTASNSYSAPKMAPKQTWYGNTHGSTQAPYNSSYNAYATAVASTSQASTRQSPATASSYSYSNRATTRPTDQNRRQHNYQSATQQSVRQQSQPPQAQRQPASQSYQAASSQRQTNAPYQQSYNPPYPGHSY